MKISIHPMLRFNALCQQKQWAVRVFQYILCYGSTKCKFNQLQPWIHFNTSYVTVQPKSTLERFIGISNFNTSYVTVQPAIVGMITVSIIVFQYILCYGSTYMAKKMGWNDYGFQYILCYGSTSEFSCSKASSSAFQYILCYGSTSATLSNISSLKYFNTSYVTVQRGWNSWRGLKMPNFNTSYVTVQHYRPIYQKGEFIEFQYILCYGSTYRINGGNFVQA